MHTLFVISTPIGNLEDISIRAVKTLWSVEVVFCEDTRETQHLLNAYPQFQKNAHAPRLIPLTDYNEQNKIGEVVNYLRDGKDIALVSDRGTPLISDPGYKIVREVIHLQKKLSHIQLTVVPGANAILSSLILSGLAPNTFYFIGFIPKKPHARKKLFLSLPETTIVAYESPYRLVDTLLEMEMVWGAGFVVVCRELTKLHEEVIRGSFRDVAAHFKTKRAMGEVTLVFSKEAIKET